MKHIINIFGCALLAGATFVACQEKEIAGPAPASDLSVNPGYLRAEVEFAAPADAKTARVFFNSGKFADFDVNAAEATQKFLVEDLDEGDQTLRVITTNEAGVKSDPKGFQTHIYGPKYQSSLSNRILIDQAVLGNNSLEVYLGDSGLDEAELRFVYFNTKGEKDSVVVAPSITTVTIDDIDLSKIYYYYTVCVPVENCIDEFTTPMVDAQKGAKKIFNKMLWVAENAANLIDDNVNTYWQASSATLPVSVTIDMTADKVFSQLVLNQALTGAGSVAKRITVEASSDGNAWTAILTDKKLALNGYCQYYDVPETTARFVKITVTEAVGEGAVKIAEIDFANDVRISGENGVSMPAFKNAGPTITVDETKIVGGPNFASRFYQMTDWIQNTDLPSSDNSSGSNEICFFSAAPWGVPDFENAKCYQILELLAGKYEFSVTWGAGDVGSKYMPAYIVATAGDVLNDIDTASSELVGDPNTLGYAKVSGQGTTTKNVFTVPENGRVSIGFVLCTRSAQRYTELADVPWAQNYVNSISLVPLDVE